MSRAPAGRASHGRSVRRFPVGRSSQGRSARRELRSGLRAPVGRSTHGRLPGREARSPVRLPVGSSSRGRSALRFPVGCSPHGRRALRGAPSSRVALLSACPGRLRTPRLPVRCSSHGRARVRLPVGCSSDGNSWPVAAPRVRVARHDAARAGRARPDRSSPSAARVRLYCTQILHDRVERAVQLQGSAVESRSTRASGGSASASRTSGESGRRTRTPTSSTTRSGLYVVADGMGGHAAGEVASQEAVETVYGMVKRGISGLHELRRAADPRRRARGMPR